MNRDKFLVNYLNSNISHLKDNKYHFNAVLKIGSRSDLYANKAIPQDENKKISLQKQTLKYSNTLFIYLQSVN